MDRQLVQGAGPRAAVGWRALGIAGSKGLALARTLALARLLAPADFGLYAVALVPLDFLLGVTDLGLAPALVQRADVGERHYDAAWTVGLARGAAVALALALGAPLAAALLGDPRATDLVRALAVRPVIAAAASARTAALERDLRYRALAGVDLAGAAATTALALLLARPLGAWALVAGSLGGAAAATAASYAAAPHRPRLAFDHAHARPLLRFGRWVLAGNVAALVGDAALRAVVARTLGTDALGLYSLAANLAAAPIGLAGSAVGGVAFAVHARLQDDRGRAERAYRATLGLLAALLLPVYTALVVLAPALVAHVFGPRWAGTAPVIRWLAVAGLLGVVFDATVPLLNGRGRPRAAAAVYAAFTVSTLALAWPLARSGGLAGVGLAVALAEAVVCATCVVLARRTLERPFRGLARPLGLGVAAAAAAGAVAAAAVAWAPAGAGVVLGGAAALLVAAGATRRIYKTVAA